MADVVLFGVGQIAEVARIYIDTHGPDRVVGFTVDAAYKSVDTFHGLPVVAWEDLETGFSKSEVKLLGPLSYQRLNEFRRDRHLEGKARGYQFTTFIHPATFNYASHIGENCLILENNVLQPFVQIGDGVIIWSGNHVGHHAVIGDYCFIASQVGIGGGATVGERCFLGGKSSIESGLTIGAGCYLGSATLVRKSLTDESVLPARGDRIAKMKSSRLKRMRFR